MTNTHETAQGSVRMTVQALWFPECNSKYRLVEPLAVADSRIRRRESSEKSRPMIIRINQQNY